MVPGPPDRKGSVSTEGEEILPFFSFGPGGRPVGPPYDCPLGTSPDYLFAVSCLRCLGRRSRRRRGD